MRTPVNAEQSFKSQLVENMKRLVKNDSLSLAQKVATIRNAVKQNSAEITSLKSSFETAEDDGKKTHLLRLITLRENATKYMTATENWLLQTDKDSLSFRQPPQTYAVPDWQTTHGTIASKQ